MSRVDNPEKAVNLVIGDLQRVISCVTWTRLAAIRRQTQTPTTSVFVRFPSGRAKLTSGRWISVAVKLRPQTDDARTSAWRAAIEAYTFAIFATENGRTEMLSYHYHPSVGVTWPHLHVKAKADWAGKRSLRKHHLFTGHVTGEDFVQFLIEDLDVGALDRQWKHIIEENRARA